MTEDDKRKAQRHFTWQAIKDAVERMKPELIAASEAAHKAKDADDKGDDPDYDFDRTVELGYLVESLGGLCGPHLLLLNQIAEALYELHATDDQHGQEIPHRRH
jgi:hypothetical protein